MKKKLTILALLVPLFLTGCSTNDDVSSIHSDEESESIDDDSEEDSSELIIPVESVKLDRSTYSIFDDDEEASLTMTILPEDATNQEVTWSSSKTNVATVEDGKITPVGTGTTTITVTTEDGNKTARCNVTVKPAITIPSHVIHIKRYDSSVWEDEEIILNPATTNEYYIQSFYLHEDDVFKIHMYGDTWYGYSDIKDSAKSRVDPASSDDNILVRTSGYYDIYSSYDYDYFDHGHIYLDKVGGGSSTVNVEDIELNRSAVYLKVRTGFTLEPTIYPSNATNKNVYWTSSDASIATVTNAGRIVCSNQGNKGSTIITATTEDGNKTATCVVYVSPAYEPDYTLTGTIGGYSRRHGTDQTRYGAVPLGDGTYMISDVQLIPGDEISVYSYLDGHSLRDKSYNIYKYKVNTTMFVNIYLNPKSSNFNYLSFTSKKV